MSPSAFHHFCPRCGVRQAAPPAGNVFTCSACRFRLFFNAASAIGVFITRPDGRALLIVRAKDPGQGKLAPPGGFIDLGETAEAAARREIREEVGLEIEDVEFLCSHPNSYLYDGVTYPVLDLFFTARPVPGAEARPLDEVTSVRWVEPATVAAEDLAFVSMQAAWRAYRARPARG